MASGKVWPFAGKEGRPPFTGWTNQFGSAPWGGTNNIGGATPLTVNDTTYLPLPTPDVGSAFIGGAVTVNTTLASDADGTVLAGFYKYDVSAAAYVLMSAQASLEATGGAVLKTAQYVGPKTGFTNADLIFETGDTLYLGVVNNSAAIDTQPAGIVGNCKCSIASPSN